MPIPQPTKTLSPELRVAPQEGLVIPAHPLALDENRRMDVTNQRALTCYYLASGAGGIAAIFIMAILIPNETIIIVMTRLLRLKPVMRRY